MGGGAAAYPNRPHDDPRGRSRIGLGGPRRRERSRHMDPQFPMIGRLTNDPAQQATASGLKVTRFRMASNGRRYDRNSGEWVSTDPVYMSVVCWRQLGDNVMQTLGRGDAVIVV